MLNLRATTAGVYPQTGPGAGDLCAFCARTLVVHFYSRELAWSAGPCRPRSTGGREFHR